MIKDQSSNQMLKHALNYLEKGLSIIPVGCNKKPLIPSWKEFQERHPSKDEVIEWFTKYPNANIAIITGAISNIVVIDVEEGGNIDDFPKTLTVITGGNGWHLYYKYDPNKPIGNHTRIRELTDIRGDGGYVIVPPSLHKSGNKYKWDTSSTKEINDFPYWLIENVNTTVEKNKKNKTDWNNFLKTPVLKGKRNNQAVKYSGKLINDLPTKLIDSKGLKLLINWNDKNCKPPLKENELKTILNSVKKTHNSNNKKYPTKEIYSLNEKDCIAEIIYNPQESKTQFVTLTNNNIQKKSSFKYNGTLYFPTPHTNVFIEKRIIKLPSDITDIAFEGDLLNEIKSFIHKYVQLSPEFEEIACYYVMFTWVYDAFHELPYLRVIGDYGSGKSRFLKVIGSISYRSIFFNGASSMASIFRTIDEIKGTVIIDEADFQTSDTTNETVKILNSGFQKDMPILRCETKGNKNKSYDPTPFEIYCPKVLATRREYTDKALESRCLTYAMETLTREDISENLDDKFDQEALKLRNKLLAFRLQKLSKGVQIKRLPKLDIEPRLKQIITPIYSIFEEENCKQRIIQFICTKQKSVTEARFNSVDGRLLRTIIICLKEDFEPRMEKIAKTYNDTFPSKIDISARKVGEICGRTFHLEKFKKTNGYVILDNHKNQMQIEKLKKKYGVDDMNIMNVMNNDNELPFEELPCTSD